MGHVKGPPGGRAVHLSGKFKNPSLQGDLANPLSAGGCGSLSALPKQGDLYGQKRRGTVWTIQ